MAVGMAASAIGLNGCAVALLGAGAAGGYAIGKDSVTSHFDHSQGRVYREALAAAEHMGLVEVEDEAHGLIKAVCVFLVIRQVNALRRKEDVESISPTQKSCPFCYSSISIKATRCPQCTSQLSEGQT